MFFAKKFVKRTFSALALSGFLLTGVQILAKADSNPGLTIFSGVDRKDLLGHNLQFGGRPNTFDRYKLYISGKKMTTGAQKFVINYPDYYEGKIDVDNVEVRMKGESLPIREVVWDKESYLIEIDMVEPILESHKVTLVFHNVRNPRFGGTFYFHCNVVTPGDIPLPVYLGSWILTIGR